MEPMILCVQSIFQEEESEQIVATQEEDGFIGTLKSILYRIIDGNIM
ncbi:MAG: hypothetical protein ACLTC8_06080 [Lachnospiraceae bacterium]